MAVQDYVTNNAYQLGQNGQATGRYFLNDPSGVSHEVMGANSGDFQALGVDPTKIATIDQFAAPSSSGGNFDASQLSTQANQFSTNVDTNAAANKLAGVAPTSGNGTPGFNPAPQGSSAVSTQTNDLQSATPGQTGLQMPGTTQGLQMPTGAAAGTVFDPISGKQVSPAEKAFNELQAQGAAPQDKGTAQTQLNQQIQQNTPVDNSKQIAAISTTLNNDPGWQQLLSDAKNIQSVSTQQQSLTQQYQNLLTQYNIPGIDTQLLNDQKIINGTEDDIRNEVQAAGGFATESQVLALSSARNKTLIQNYNDLLNTKTAAMQQISTISGLQAQDKQNAISVANNQLNIDQQLASYQQKFQDNAKQAYNNVISAVGYSGLYQSLAHDPASLSLAEQTLGLAPGQLQQLGTQANTSAQLDLQLKQTQLQQAQQNLTLNAQEEPLKVKALQANINQSNASAGASAASANKTNLETQYEQQNGGQTQAEVIKQNAIQADTTALYSWLQTQQGKNFGDTGSGGDYVSPTTYKQALSAWVSDGHSASDFDAVFGQFINPKHSGDYVASK